MSLKRSIWLVSRGAGKEGNSKRFFASRHPPIVCLLRDHLNSSAALRPKDGKSSKRFSLMCQCSKRSSYLNIYLEQRAVLPKSSCPHFSVKRWCRGMTDLQIQAIFFQVCHVESEVAWDGGRRGGENASRVWIQTGLCLGACRGVGWM